jgi:hypothetical protein
LAEWSKARVCKTRRLNTLVRIQYCPQTNTCVAEWLGNSLQNCTVEIPNVGSTPTMRALIYEFGVTIAHLVAQPRGMMTERWCKSLNSCSIRLLGFHSSGRNRRRNSHWTCNSAVECLIVNQKVVGSNPTKSAD